MCRVQRVAIRPACPDDLRRATGAAGGAVSGGAGGIICLSGIMDVLPDVDSMRSVLQRRTCGVGHGRAAEIRSAGRIDGQARIVGEPEYIGDIAALTESVGDPLIVRGDDALTAMLDIDKRDRSPAIAVVIAKNEGVVGERCRM